jgi:hypothetical protein
MYTDTTIAAAPAAPIPEQPRPRPRPKIKRKREASYTGQGKRHPEQSGQALGDRNDQVDRYV